MPPVVDVTVPLSAPPASVPPFKVSDAKLCASLPSASVPPVLIVTAEMLDGIGRRERQRAARY